MFPLLNMILIIGIVDQKAKQSVYTDDGFIWGIKIENTVKIMYFPLPVSPEEYFKFYFFPSLFQ